MKKKIVVTGNDAVGKTVLVRGFTTGKLPADYKATLGVEILVKLIKNFKGSETLEVNFWDFAGQERFEEIREIYYSGTDGALILFDLTRIGTFHSVPKWIQELREKCNNKNVPFILVGNKLDLAKLRRIPEEQIEKYLKQYDIKYYKEISALKGWGVEELFNEIFSLIT
ncbi:MAG: Rab family GTPase [Candidatus Helarchaeota archaeon]